MSRVRKARKLNITSILLTLCPEYKLLTPILKSAYLSLLNIVLVGIVPGKQTVPSMMNHSLFTLSSTLPGLLAPFLGHFSRCYGISHKTFAFSFFRHGTGWLCLYHGRKSWDSLNSNFSNNNLYCGTAVVAFNRACPYTASVLFWSSHIVYGVLFLDC